MKFIFKEKNLKWYEESELACGGGTRKKLSSSEVNNDNIAKCKCLFISNDNLAVCIVIIDALYIGKSLNTAILEIARKYNIEAIVCATHTHYMPNISEEYSFFGEIHTDYIKIIINALDLLFDEYSNSPNLSSSVNVRVSRVVSNRVTYRRKFLRRLYVDVKRVLNHLDFKWNRKLSLKSKGLIMAPEIGVDVKSPSSIIFFDSETDSIALLSNSTHPTNKSPVTSSRDVYSILENLAEKNNYTFLAGQGFASDLKISSQKPTGIFKKIRSIIFGSSYSTPMLDELEQYSNDIFNENKQGIGEFDMSSIIRNQCEYWLGTYDQNGNKLVYKFVFLQVGNILFVFSNSEVSHYYYEFLRSNVNEDIYIFPLSCEGECVGYLPYISQLGENGYEDSKFIDYFGFSGKIDRIKLSVFLEKIKTLCKDVS